MDHEQRLRLLDEALTDGARMGLILRTPDDEPLDGRLLRFEGQELLSFGSSSYLGLELDPRLRDGVRAAVDRYGTQFSSSRTYLSAPAYRTLETVLEGIFGGPVLVTPSTTLGHLSAIPTLVGEHDAIVLDQQVHHSVKLGANQARVQGTHVEVLRHNRMDLLDARVAELAPRHPRVWYMADGVYSMYADLAPAADLAALLDRHEQLQLYVDDSHGMSWAGRHGRGEFLERMPVRDRLVVACSLNKAFAAAGAALVFPDRELKRRVLTLGGPMIFSGPIQPPMLGAALASARIHLSDEIADLQAGLRQRVRLYNELAAAAGLPVVSSPHAPIRTVGVGLPHMAYELGRRLISAGLYVNVAAFPAVPVKQAGIRASLTLHHRPEDIERLVDATAAHLHDVLTEHGTSAVAVAEQFGVPAPAAAHAAPPTGSHGPAGTTALRVQHETTVAALDAREWDALLGGRGAFTARALALYEDVFKPGARPEDAWRWHYFVVRDSDGAPVAASFFTRALWKDDMLFAAPVSRRVEEERRTDPYFLTTPTFAMGSLITEGDHLFLDRARDWRGALAALIAAAAAEQRREEASTLVLRDVPDGDAELHEALGEAGFVRVGLPDAHVLDLDFATDEEFLARLSPKARRHQRREVRPWEAFADVELREASATSPAEIDALHRLYRNVHGRGFDLNTFSLPREFLAAVAADADWELLLLYLRPDGGRRAPSAPVAFGAHFLGTDVYCPLVIGLDYEHVLPHRTYRQMLWQSIKRARELGYERLAWGMGASLEKQRFGARVERRSAWVQATDHYNMDVLEQIGAGSGLTPVAYRVPGTQAS